MYWDGDEEILEEIPLRIEYLTSGTTFSVMRQFKKK
jgi:hypothetical protein